MQLKTLDNFTVVCAHVLTTCCAPARRRRTTARCSARRCIGRHVSPGVGSRDRLRLSSRVSGLQRVARRDAPRVGAEHRFLRSLGPRLLSCFLFRRSFGAGVGGCKQSLSLWPPRIRRRRVLRQAEHSRPQKSAHAVEVVRFLIVRSCVSTGT